MKNKIYNVACYEYQQHISSQDCYNQVILNLHHKKESSPQHDLATLVELINFFFLTIVYILFLP